MTISTLNYVNEYLLDCETKQSDMMAYIDSTWEDVEVVDIIGTVEDEGRIHIGMEVVYNGYSYMEHISFMNMWDYVYKDEVIEISDMIGIKLGEQLEIDLNL